MAEGLVFADRSRGIYASKSGAIYICDRGTFDLKAAPLAVPVPFRIILSDVHDPFMIVFSGAGYVHVYDMSADQWTLEVDLPVNVGVVNWVTIKNEGKMIIMNATRGVFCYQNGWTMLSEPADSLVVKLDSTVNAQATVLETAIAAAVQMNDVVDFEQAVLKYLVYLATYAPIEAFLSNWYSLIAEKSPFEGNLARDLWKRILGLLSGLDRIDPFMEELKMSVEQIPIGE
jgi:hypothetical protein